MIKKDVRLEGAASQGALRQSNASGKTGKGTGDPDTPTESSDDTIDKKDDVGEDALQKR